MELIAAVTDWRFIAMKSTSVLSKSKTTALIMWNTYDAWPETTPATD
jgi:hypothetical protein